MTTLTIDYSISVATEENENEIVLNSYNESIIITIPEKDIEVDIA